MKSPSDSSVCIYRTGTRISVTNEDERNLHTSTLSISNATVKSSGTYNCFLEATNNITYLKSVQVVVSNQGSTHQFKSRNYLLMLMFVG